MRFWLLLWTGLCLTLVVLNVVMPFVAMSALLIAIGSVWLMVVVVACDPNLLRGSGGLDEAQQRVLWENQRAREAARLRAERAVAQHIRARRRAREILKSIRAVRDAELRDTLPEP